MSRSDDINQRYRHILFCEMKRNPNRATLERDIEELRNVIGWEQTLLILDDVRDKADILPFLELRGCTILITTRFKTIKFTPNLISIRTMTDDEACRVVEPLYNELSSADQVIVDKMISEIKNRWPLLLSLEGGYMRRWMERGYSRAVAVEKTIKAYEEGGILSFDDPDSEEADRQKIAKCIEISLEPLTDLERLLFLQLGIFQQKQHIPRQLIAELWAQQIQPGKIQHLLDTLAGLSLLEQTDQAVSLHDEIADYIEHNQNFRSRVITFHDDFVDVVAEHYPLHRLTAKSSPDLVVLYLMQYLSYHFVRAGENRKEDLYALVGNLRFLAEKIIAFHAVEAIEVDFIQAASFPSLTLQLLHDSIRQSHVVLESIDDPLALALTIYVRLPLQSLSLGERTRLRQTITYNPQDLIIEPVGSLPEYPYPLRTEWRSTNPFQDELFTQTSEREEVPVINICGLRVVSPYSAIILVSQSIESGMKRFGTALLNGHASQQSAPARPLTVDDAIWWKEIDQDVETTSWVVSADGQKSGICSRSEVFIIDNQNEGKFFQGSAYHTAAISHIQFLAGGRVLTDDHEGRICLNSDDLQKYIELLYPPRWTVQTPSYIAVSADSSHVICATTTGACGWHLNENTAEFEQSIEPAWILETPAVGVAFSHDQSHYIVTHCNGVTICTQDHQTYVPYPEETPYLARVYPTAQSQVVIVQYDNGNLAQWRYSNVPGQDTRAISPIVTREPSDLSGELGFAISPNGAALIYTHKQEPIRVWDIRGAREFMTIGTVRDSVRSLQFTADGTQLWCITDNDEVFCWDTSGLSQRFSHFIELNTQQIKSSTASQTETQLIVIDRNKAIIYSSDGQHILSSFALPGSPIDCAVGRQAAAVISDDGQVYVWRSDMSAWHSSGVADAACVAIAPDDSTVVLTTTGDIFRLDGDAVAHVGAASGTPISCAFLKGAQDDDMFVVATNESHLILFGWPALALLKEIRDDRPGRYQQFATHNNKGITVAQDNTGMQKIKLWQFSNGKPQFKGNMFRPANKAVTSLALHAADNMDWLGMTRPFELTIQRGVGPYTGSAQIHTEQPLAECAWLAHDQLYAIGLAGLYRFRVTIAVE